MGWPCEHAGKPAPLPKRQVASRHVASSSTITRFMSPTNLETLGLRRISSPGSVDGLTRRLAKQFQMRFRSSRLCTKT